MFSSPLRRAIDRGMRPGGDLASELRDLDDYSVHSRKDAKAICDALSRLSIEPPQETDLTSPLYALAALFQDVDGREAPAFDVLHEEGLPQLMRILDARIEQVTDGEDVDDLLFVLKILAMYGTREGAERVVSAAQKPLRPDGYLWHVILSIFSDGHPQRDYVFDALSDPLPKEFIAVGLLDSANGAAIEGDLQAHPFNSPAGVRQLQDWLEDRNPENFSYAHSATAALPFISNPARDQLLALAMDHLDAGVQMEAAWAAGKLGREAGLKILARFCLNVSHSDVAQRYLAELDQEELIPNEACEPGFRALADFARWLAHPNELGQPPDELEIVDHRNLPWPPNREVKPFWLIRYLLHDRTGLEEDDVDCGLVGSMTWCFFSYNMDQRPPEDAYAIHCYWEMEHAELIKEAEVNDTTEYDVMLGQWQGESLTDPQITHVAELSTELQYPTGLVALATAKLGDNAGWVVLDGPRSTWYPKSDQPSKTPDNVLLNIHVGRQLLGFDDQPQRKKFLDTGIPGRNPQQVIDAYEQLLTDAAAAEPKQQESLLGGWSLLSRHFNAYADAVCETRAASHSETVVKVYNQFLQLAQNADGSIRDEVLDTTSLMGDTFDDYVDALVALGRENDIRSVVEWLTPHWKNNLGYGRLGEAAFKAGERELAEGFLLKLRDGTKHYFRSEGMSMLAEIWHDRGETDPARKLLLDCLSNLVLEIRTSKYNSDRRMFADEFQYHRSTYLRLFPDGQPDLDEADIPDDPLKQVL